MMKTTTKEVGYAYETAAEAALPPAPGSADERPRFDLARVKPRRAARGLETAGVKVTWPDGEVELLWMTAADIMENIETWGRCNGLAAALDAYLPNRPDEAHGDK